MCDCCLEMRLVASVCSKCFQFHKVSAAVFPLAHFFLAFHDVTSAKLQRCCGFGCFGIICSC